MLHEFIRAHRDAIIERARARVAARRVPVATAGEVASGVPMFLSQLVGVLREQREQESSPLVPATDAQVGYAVGATADQLGDDMMRAGLTVAQVVEGYGDVCQAVADHAIQLDARISVDEYRALNLCLDLATARAVTAFSREQSASIRSDGTERLGVLSHELRNLLSTAVLSYEAMKRGGLGFESKTGALLGRSLRGLRDVVDRSLAEVRLAAALHEVERVELVKFVEEIEVGATLDARARGLELSVAPVEAGLAIDADRQLLASAVSNLVQNAIKFTRPGGRVSLTVRRNAGRVHIDVEDECGGLPDGQGEGLFEPFEQAASDRSGLGLGLKISRDAVKANGGELRVRDLPGKGCVFTIELPVAKA